MQLGLSITFFSLEYKLKADRPHLRDYPPTPTDYRHKDKHLRLVMILIGLCCKDEGRRSTGSAVRAQTNGRMDRRTDATNSIISLLR